MSVALERGGFFRTPPGDVTGDLVNLVNLLAADACEAIDVQLRKDGLDPKVVKQGVDQHQLKFHRNIDSSMGKFEEYALRDIFRVPDDLVLTDTDELTGEQQPGAEPVAVLDEELVQLAERVQGAISARRALVAELRQLRAQAAAQQAYAPALAPILSLAPADVDAHDSDAQLCAALQTLESNVAALDHIRDKILSRLAHGALANGADALMHAAPTIKTGDLEDLARLSRTLRSLR